jgi:hypothetical protein
MSNFHFDLSLKLPQGDVHMTFQERCETISGDVLTSPQNLAIESGFTMHRIMAV